MNHALQSSAARLSLAIPLLFAALGCKSSGPSGAAPDGGEGDSGACSAATHCTYFAADATEDTIQNGIATATEGSTFIFAEGTFSFLNELTLGASGVSITGAGIDKTIFDFSHQASGSEGIFAQNVHNLRLEGFTVKDTKGNGVKVLGSVGVVLRAVKATWTGTNATLHGAYGLYPVQCENVLIEGCVASGASDSGLYIGQSKNVVVRNSEAFANVAGIEIENTFFADVHDNNAHDNTGGILVFDLPELQQLGGHGVRIHGNKIHDNNRKNFAPAGNIVGNVPAGTGSFVMANHDVELFGNAFTNNKTANLAVVSYLVVQIPIKDTKYYPYPAKISIHGNTFSGGGTSPDTDTPLGLILQTATSAFPDQKVPDVLYDGVTDPKITVPAANPMQICVNQPGSHFSNLSFEELNASNSNLAMIVKVDPPGFGCALPPLDPVVLPGPDGGAF